MVAFLVRAVSAALFAAWLGHSAQAATLGTLVGQSRHVEVAEGDTLLALAERYGIGYVELRAANPGVDVWLPEVGSEVVIPSAHIAPLPEGAGVVVNRAELRVYVYPADSEIWSAPISVGRDGYGTPLGHIAIGEKRRSPAWYPTAAHREEDPDLPAVVPPGPDNPLGSHAVRLGNTAYLLHGTNRPRSIGRQVSRGCIRMAPSDIAALYESVEVGMAVRIVDAPVKLARADGRLYLEVAPSRDQARALDMGWSLPEDPATTAEEAVRTLAGDLVTQVDWSAVARIARERRGVPEAITPPLDISPSGGSVTSALRD